MNAVSFFFFNDTATTEIYTLSLHDALPILRNKTLSRMRWARLVSTALVNTIPPRSEEHTSELQSQSNLVCRLLLEKKKIHHVLHPPTTTPLLSHLAGRPRFSTQRPISACVL